MVELDGIRFDALVFRQGADLISSQHLYVATTMPEEMIRRHLPADTAGWWYKRVDICTEAGAGRFFIAHTADCFDPPCAVIRAGCLEEASEIFVENFPYSPKIAEPDLRDYLDENGDPSCAFTEEGTPYDAEHMHIESISLWLAIRVLGPGPRGQGPATPPGVPARAPRRQPGDRRLDLS